VPDGDVHPSSDSGTTLPATTLESIGWERIQLVLRLRPSGAPLVAPRLRAERAEEDAGVVDMPPTWSGPAADGATVVRFNIMLGPGQKPLPPGTWSLVHGSDATAASAMRLEGADPIEVFLAERTFRFRGGWYRVAPRLDREAATLHLDIARRRRHRRRAWYRRLRPAWTTPTGLRSRIFAALLGWHRRTASRTGRRVVFTSDSHAGLSGNLAVVHDRMVARGLDRDYELTTIFKPSVTASRRWRDRWRLPRLLAQADVILLDDYQPVIYRLPQDPGQRIVQLWHAAGAFKTVGYSRIGKPGGPSPYWRRHKNYTAAIVSGHHDVPYYAEAFGLPEERVTPTGIPRMDRFFDEQQRASARASAQAAIPAIAGRWVILFAPTFRGHGPRDAWYDYDRVDWHRLAAAAAARDAVVVVKMHPFVREPAPIPPELADRIVDGTHAAIDVNDLLFAVDLLITDYSSIVFEFSTFLKPMLFFAYDLEEYVADRDFYVPFEEFVPGRIARSFDDVLAAIRDDEFERDKVAVFARRHFDHLDGSATDRVIDQLILAR
jgi:CDP-ribitol ribitolphosphotransferase